MLDGGGASQHAKGSDALRFSAKRTGMVQEADPPGLSLPLDKSYY